MLCICTQRLEGLTGALARLDLRMRPPALPGLQGFAAMLGPPGLDPDLLAQFLDWLEGVEIPPLALSPAQLAGISGAARAVIAIRTHLGFDPLAVKVAPTLAFGEGPAGVRLALLNLARTPVPLLDRLAALLPAIETLKLALDLDPLASSAHKKLTLALRGWQPIIFPRIRPRLQAKLGLAARHAMLMQATATLGLPPPGAGGTARFAAMMRAAAAVPGIRLGLGPAAMAGLDGLAAKLAVIKLVGGIDPTMPNLLADLLARLAELARVQFPAGPAAAPPTLPIATASLQALMGMDLRATAAITASVAPMSAGLQQMALAASIVARFDAAGLTITARPPCMGVCPLSGLQPPFAA